MSRIVLLLMFSLCGCGTDSAWSVLADPLHRLNAGGADALPEEEPDGPSLRITQGRRAADAALIEQQGERRMWRTRGGVVIATHGARIVATAGLPMLLAATRFDGPDPLAEPAALLVRSADSRRMVDLMERARDPSGMRFGVTMNCTLVAGAAEDDVVPINETCRSEQLGIIRNRFWMDRESATITTSEQWVGPGIAPLRLDHFSAAAVETPPAAAQPEAAPVAEAPPGMTGPQR